MVAFASHNTLLRDRFSPPAVAAILAGDVGLRRDLNEVAVWWAYSQPCPDDTPEDAHTAARCTVACGWSLARAICGALQVELDPFLSLTVSAFASEIADVVRADALAPLGEPRHPLGVALERLAEVDPSSTDAVAPAVDLVAHAVALLG